LIAAPTDREGWIVVTMSRAPMRAPMPVADLRRLSWPTALGAHLGPGLVAFVAALLLAPAVARL